MDLWGTFDPPTIAGYNVSPVPLPNSRKGRKRRVTDFENSGTSPGTTRKFISAEALLFPSLAKALEENHEDLIKLILRVMPNKEIGILASINKTWNRLVAETLRERSGNRPFVLLWIGNYLRNLEPHFHPGYMQYNNQCEPKPKVASLFDGTNRKGQEISQISDQYGFLYRTTRLRNLKEVETIIMFGSPGMDDRFNEAYEDNELPPVRTIVFVTCPFVYYESLESSQHYSTKNENILASICVPKSSSFFIECRNVPPALDNLSRWMGAMTLDKNPALSVKGVLVLKLKLYDQSDSDLISNSVQEVVKRGLEKVDAVPVTSVECYFVDTSGPRSSQPLAVIISFMGDKSVSFIKAIFCPGEQSSKFQELKDNITNNIIFGRYSSFAFLLASSVVDDDSRNIGAEFAKTILSKFRQSFPHIPIHGLGSHQPILNETYFGSAHHPLAAVTSIVSTDGSNQRKQDLSASSVTIIVVSYPGESNSSESQRKERASTANMDLD